MNIQEQLRTHTPSLLPPEKWPMSKGDMHIKPFSETRCDIFSKADKNEYGNPICLATNVAISYAAYIAACSPDELVEELWDAYTICAHVIPIEDEPYIGMTYRLLNETADKILQRLSRMGVLEWKAKK